MAQQSNSDSSRLMQDWGVYTPRELKERCRDFGSDDLIEGLLPNRSLSLLVGDSGLGKSALMYQMGLCVAAGVDFLGRKTQKGGVLIMDYENGLRQVDELIASLARHLGLSEVPDDLLIWNYNDCHPQFGQVGQTATDLIRAVRPTLTIIDSITGLKPEIEEKNSEATKVYQSLRTIMRECGSSFLASHHRKKISDNGFSTPPSLENGNIRSWFVQARGAGALINSSDVRLAIDEPKSQRGNNNDPALVIRGFSRVRGEIPSTYLARVRDDDGEPLGYERLSGASLLFNAEQAETFSKLPAQFRFKNAQMVYGKGAQATTDFLNKCINVGLIRKTERGYEKL